MVGIDLTVVLRRQIMESGLCDLQGHSNTYICMRSEKIKHYLKFQQRKHELMTTPARGPLRSSPRRSARKTSAFKNTLDCKMTEFVLTFIDSQSIKV